MASTLTTQALSVQTPGTLTRNFRIQSATTDTAAESVTITHILPGLADATDASARMIWNPQHQTAASVTAGAEWYEVSRSTTTLVLAKAQAASAVSNVIVTVRATHSLIA